MSKGHIHGRTGYVLFAGQRLERTSLYNNHILEIGSNYDPCIMNVKTQILRSSRREDPETANHFSDLTKQPAKLLDGNVPNVVVIQSLISYVILDGSKSRTRW